jgi:hypothetical protein
LTPPLARWRPATAGLDQPFTASQVKVDAIQINGSTLEGWYLLQGKAGAVSFTTDI